MNRRYLAMILLVVGAGGTQIGCVPNMTIDQMKEMKIVRPPELELLRMFAGKWESTGRAKMAGLEEDLMVTGTSEGTWHAGRFCLVNEDVFTLGKLGDMKALTVWRWDAKSRVFRSHWTYNDGSAGTGKATFDPLTKTWHYTTKGSGPWCSLKGKGTIKYLDENNVLWEWHEWDGTGLVKIMELKGSSRRK